MQEVVVIVGKLKEELVLPNKLSKYRKNDLINEIDNRKLLARMSIFYAQGPDDGIPSRIHQSSDEDAIVPSKEQLKKMKVGQIRSLLRSFYRDSGLVRGKLEALGPKKLKVFANKHNFREMAGLPLDVPDEKSKSTGKKAQPDQVPTDPEASSDPPAEAITDTAGLLQHLNEFSKKIVPDDDNLLPSERIPAEYGGTKKMKNNLTQFDPYADPIVSLAPHLFQRLCERALTLDMAVLDCKIKKLKEFCAAVDGTEETNESSQYAPGTYGSLGGVSYLTNHSIGQLQALVALKSSI